MSGAQWAQHHTPTLGRERRAAAWFQPQRGQCLGRSHTLGGALRLQPLTLPPGAAAARCWQDSGAEQSSCRWTNRWRGWWAGRTYPFCCRVLSAGGGAPKGRAVLLREALGAKVYRGGSVAGARAWVETEPGRG